MGARMDFREFEIPGPVAITPRKFGDQRGYFTELFRQDAFEHHVGPVPFVQENQSLSAKVGTLRGLHFQTNPAAQGKLVRCAAGAMLDVAVDLRHDSPHFGRWIAVELTADANNQLWVPPGFAHGFVTLVPDVVVAYKVTSYYSAAHDAGVAWDDPDIAMVWPACLDPDALSAKDRVQPRLADLPPLFSIKD